MSVKVGIPGNPILAHASWKYLFKFLHGLGLEVKKKQVAVLPPGSPDLNARNFWNHPYSSSVKDSWAAPKTWLALCMVICGNGDKQLQYSARVLRERNAEKEKKYSH
ncbi:MAG: hypothetical protein ACRC4P_06365 [Aeromonas sp.]